MVWVAGSILTRPVSSHVPSPPAPGRVIHLTASDGVRVEGSYWSGRQPGVPAILLLHGVNSSRASLGRHALWLNGLGYAVLAIDLRGHGGSGAAPRTFGLHEARDAAAALAFLRRDHPSRRVGVIGTSLGGAAALVGEDGPLPVQAMVLQGVYPDLRSAVFNRIAQRLGRPLAYLGEPLLSYQSWVRYGIGPESLSPAEAIRRVDAPVFVIGGAADLSTPPAETRRIYRSARGPKALWIVPGTGHAATGTLWSHTYRMRVRALFAWGLGEPGIAEPRGDREERVVAGARGAG